MDYSRRKVLGMSAIGLSGVAGCLSSDETADSNGTDETSGSSNSDADNDGILDANDDYPNDPDLSQKETKSDTRKIEEDEWIYYEFDFDGSGFIEYDFIVREGPEIDVIFMDESEYTYFTNEGRFSYKSALSAFESAGTTVSGTVTEGSYRLILDNSNLGEAAPPTNFSNDVVTVEFDLEVGR
ncbi:hypothetical protein HTZ84_09290 [Haloterrigena sp. SYSU A558-1]|uniref:Uncharacterized protein n=1 Tax=Haloterrigena gelatinilytica TaxID=2741724 RepID=A0A8J8GM11_9EURY|nr:hypothetical protein [Haloterrigena gelatinilytica]NUB91668.1 hypothetical protein [Haloterrigena gelatinilytica]NUC72499.1 hypothetical protein [Haloterrigena gelatinilytica]